MKKDYVLPEKQYGVCPHCGLTINSAKETDTHIEMTCDTCGTVWKANYTYGYEDMIISDHKLTNKDKKQQKEKLIIKYEALKLDIENSRAITDIELRHETLFKLDSEFKTLCPKKYNAYFELGDYNRDYNVESYNSYLNNRSFKMVRDINKILFYFGKQ